MHTLQLIGPDLLFITTWLIGIVGVACTLVGLNGILRRGWSFQRVSGWMYPAILAQAMDHFGWAPLAATLVVVLGCWAWVVHANRSGEGRTA